MSSYVLFVFLLTTVAHIKDVASVPSAALCSIPDVIGGNYIFIDNVSENTTLGAVLKKLAFVGNDSQILLSMDPYDDISLDPVTRDLVVVKRLEVTEIDTTPEMINLFINCTVVSTGVIFSYQIIVNDYDTNDHPPTFVNAPYSCNISELTSVRATIFSSLLAADLDPGDKGYLGFYIATGPYSSMFSIPTSTNGSIVLMSPLSYEREPIINLTILVKDNIVNWTSLGQGQPHFTATTSLIIYVIPAAQNPEDNQNPAFTRTTYVGAIDANVPIGSLITTLDSPISVVAAVDASFGSACIYTIVPGNDSGSYFSIDKTTGQLVVSKPVGQSTILPFQVQATKVLDQYKYSRALILITASNANDSIPSFTYNVYNGTVVEGMPVGTLVTWVQASVTNPNEKLVYLFINSPAVTDFTINRNTGEIRTAKILSYSLMSSYTLMVQVNDSKYTKQATVSVTVVQSSTVTVVQFSQRYYLFNVTHQATVIGRVQATTSNPSRPIRYTIYDSSQSMVTSSETQSQPSGQGLFSIDANGQITVSQTLTLSAYTLIAVAVCGDSVTVLARDVTIITVLTDVSAGGVLPASVGGASSQADYRLAMIILAIICGLMLLLILCLIICLCIRNREAASKTNGSGLYEDHSHVARKSRPHGLSRTPDYDPYLAYSRDASEIGTVSTIVPHSHRVNPFSDDAGAILSDNPNYDTSSSYSPGGDHPHAGAHAGAHASTFKADTHSPPIATISSRQNSPNSTPEDLHRSPVNQGETTTALSWLDKLYPKKGEIKTNKKSTGGSSSISTSKKTPVSPSHFVSPPGAFAKPGNRFGNVSEPPSPLLLKLDDDFGMSSTDTLVPAAWTPAKPRTSKVSFVDNNIDYTSSQETISASQTAMSRTTDEPPGITVYY